MAFLDFARPRREFEAYQGPGALEDAAIAANDGFALEHRLRHGDLLPETELMLGSAFEITSWAWRPSGEESEDGHPISSSRTGLVPTTVVKRSWPRRDRIRQLCDTVWVGQ